MKCMRDEGKVKGTYIVRCNCRSKKQRKRCVDSGWLVGEGVKKHG